MSLKVSRWNLVPNALPVRFDFIDHLNYCLPEFSAYLISPVCNWCKYPSCEGILFVVFAVDRWPVAKIALKLRHNRTLPTWISMIYNFELNHAKLLAIWSVCRRVRVELGRHVVVRRKLYQKFTLDRDNQLSAQNWRRLCPLSAWLVAEMLRPRHYWLIYIIFW